MSISKDQALAVFYEHYPKVAVHRVTITETLPTNCAVYAPPTNCWFVMFSEDEFPWRLRSSRLVAISKSTGEIVYDGDVGDEG